MTCTTQENMLRFSWNNALLYTK